MDGTSGAIALKDQHGRPLHERRIFLKHDSGGKTADRIVKQDIIRRQFAKPVPRNLDFAATCERLHALQGFTHCFSILGAGA
jgi:hypothetical protein